VFAGISAYDYQSLNLTGGDQAERLLAARVTGNFFELFDVPPAAGRLISTATMNRAQAALQ